MDIDNDILAELRHAVLNAMQKFKRNNDGCFLGCLREILDKIDEGIDKGKEKIE